MGRVRSRLLAVTIVSACSFSTTLINNDATPPDAGPCKEVGVTCAGDELRRCIAKDDLPMIEPCAWGCLDGPPPHCGEVTPGGALLTTDLVDDPLLAPTVTLGAGTINTDDGSIGTDRAAGTGIVTGIDFFKRNTVSVFRFRDVTIDGPLVGSGSNALAIVAIGTITINGAVDMRGGCDGQDPGPGGTRGGNRATTGPGLGGGDGGDGGSNACSAGAGGSYGTLGGNGGKSNTQSTNPAPGEIMMNPEIAVLVGGAGGGGGGGSDNDRGQGGGGGGAIQLFATGGIVFTNGAINASGCGGNRGLANSCGGGGGAGGAILLESRTIMLGAGAKLAVNGGGGGGGDGGDGSDGQLSLSRAAGGADGGGNSGEGGSGAASAGLLGLPGQNANSAGAGGGGLGWVRLNTLNGSTTITAGAVCSPDFDKPGTTTSLGKLKVN